MKKISEKVIVGMSGGVDSSVSLLLLKNQGFAPVGVSLKYDVWRDKCNKCKENACPPTYNENNSDRIRGGMGEKGCKKNRNDLAKSGGVNCSKESFAIAKNICRKLGVEHHIIDVSREFKKQVIDYFVCELKNNRTPSPCVFCNPKVKFKSLLDFADKVGAKYVATGHYARVRECKLKTQKSQPKADPPMAEKVKSSTQNLKIFKYELLKAKDKTKDQTYSLSFLTQKELSRIVFPLGGLTKTQVYKIAKEQKGFEVFEKQKQSQDFCFISGDSLPRFLEKKIGIKKGGIIGEKGKKLGEHKGLHFYTIGQRKGIGIGGGHAPRSAKREVGPYFVVEKDSDTNTLIVSRDRLQFARRQVILKPFNLIAGKDLKESIKIMAKIRSSANPQSAELSRQRDYLLLNFAKGQDSLTPGQIAVFYDGKICIGGGVIN